MKIIQICGASGAGKTTLVKRLLNTGRYQCIRGMTSGRRGEIWYDGHTCIIGAYGKQSCGGCDPEDFTVDGFMASLRRIVRMYRPETIIFEQNIFSKLFSVKRRVLEIAKELRYGYTIVALSDEIHVQAERVLERSGRRDIDYDRIYRANRSMINSCKRIEELGANVIYIRGGGVDERLRILKGVIDGRYTEEAE